MDSPHPFRAFRPFRVYGHRGAPAELPENTLPSFARALELGCDALETDVHLTRDGQILVHHDATAARLSRDPRRIAELDLAAARRLDVGRGLHPPTLDEVLDAFPGVHVNIDIKAHTKKAARAVVACVERRREAHRVLLTSVDDAVIREVLATGYRGDVGVGKAGALLVLGAPQAMLRAAARAGWVRRQALQIPWTWKGLRFDRRTLLARGHAAGMRVDYWTVNAPDVATALVRLGADGIMTDDPARVVGAIRAAREA